MADISNPEIIYAKMRAGDYKFYQVRDSDGKSFIDTQQNSDLSTEDSVNLLQTTLSQVNGLVKVTISKKSNMSLSEGGDVNKEQLKFNLKLNTGLIAGNNNQANNMAGTPWQILLDSMKSNFDLQVQMIEQRYKHEAEMKEINQAINGTGAGTNQLITLLGPYIPQLLGVQPQQPINGVPHTQPAAQPIQHNNITMNEDQKKELNASIHKLMQLDPQFIENLKKLASLAEEKPDIYKIAISQLNNL